MFDTSYPPLAPDWFTKEDYNAHLRLRPDCIEYEADRGWASERFNEYQLKYIYCARNQLELTGQDLFLVMHEWNTKSNGVLLEVIVEYIDDHLKFGTNDSERVYLRKVVSGAVGKEGEVRAKVEAGRKAQSSQSAQTTSSSGSVQNTSSSGSTQNASCSGSTQNASSSRSRAPPANSRQTSSRQTNSQNRSDGNVRFVNTFRDEYPATSTG